MDMQQTQDGASTEPPGRTGTQPCRGCDAEPGQHHSEGCDHAACPDCGDQQYSCDCAADTGRPALWHGVDPRAEIARTLNWWTSASGIDRPVENYTRVLFAIELGQVAWDPQTQKYTIGNIDNAALDRAIARSS